jgi:outer membrane protein assembly factor BamB
MPIPAVEPATGSESNPTTLRFVAVDIVIAARRAFVDEAQLEKEILDHLSELVAFSDYAVVRGSAQSPLPEAWGTLEVKYYEAPYGRYTAGSVECGPWVVGTSVVITMAMRSNSGAKTTWDAVRANYQPGTMVFTFTDDPVSEQSLRDIAFRAAWGNVPPFHVSSDEPAGTARAGASSVGPEREVDHASRPAPIGTIKWQFQIAKAICRSCSVGNTPAVAGDLVYMTTHENALVFAVERESGTLRWVRELIKADLVSATSPEILGTRVIVGTSEGLFAVDRYSGEVAWSHADFGFTRVGTAPGALVAVSSQAVRCLGADNGEILWSVPLESSQVSAPGLDQDHVYVVYRFPIERTIDMSRSPPRLESPGSVLCLSLRTGAEVWRVPLPGSVVGLVQSHSPLIADEGIYATVGSSLYLIDPTARKAVWRFRAGDDIDCAPLSHSGMAFIRAKDGCVYAIDVDNGREIWKVPLRARSRPEGSQYDFPIALADDALYVGSDSGWLFTLNPGTGAIRWAKELGGRCGGGPVIAGSSIYIPAGAFLLRLN